MERHQRGLSRAECEQSEQDAKLDRGDLTGFPTAREEPTGLEIQRTGNRPCPNQGQHQQRDGRREQHPQVDAATHFCGVRTVMGDQRVSRECHNLVEHE